MMDKVNSRQTPEWEESLPALDELTHSLTNIKNNIRECIQDIENTTQIKRPLIHSMRSAMKDIEQAAEAIQQINNCMLNKPIVG